MVLFIAACAGDEELPFVEFDGLGYGAYPRLIDGVNGALDYEDPANSNINFTVEFYDDAQGQNVDKIEWTVSYLDTYGPAVLETREKGSFGTSPDGYPSAEFTFGFQQVFDALGIDIGTINGGDPFVFRSTVTKNDGSTYTSSTSSGSIQSGVFGGFFFYSADVANLPCKSKIAGTFDAETTVTSVDGTPDGWNGCAEATENKWKGTVIWEAVHDPESFDKGRYRIFVVHDDGPLEDATMGAYTACYGCVTADCTPNGDSGAGDVTIGESCDKLSWNEQGDQWTDTYSFDELTVDGINLTLKWKNTYGEAGTTVLTRTDGATWPAGLTL